MMENTNHLAQYYNSYMAERPLAPFVQENPQYPAHSYLVKRKPKRTFRPTCTPLSLDAAPEGQYSRGLKLSRAAPPAGRDDYEIQNVLKMIDRTGKNYIALLHEYSKKSNKAVTYEYEVKKDKSRYPNKE